MTLAHSSALAGEPCAGCSKFPTYIYYIANKISIAAQSRQGHASDFIKHSYARHSYSAPRYTDPQRPHSPHRRRQSPHSPSPLSPAAALLFSSPTAPCVTMVTRTRLLACGSTSGQPKDGWRRTVDVVPGHDDEPAASGDEPSWIQPLRPSREQLLHSR
jgi:hypothetical protein